MSDFSGVKLALVYGSKVVGILRENSPNIMFSNCWDVAGGPHKGGGARARFNVPFEKPMKNTV